MNVNEYDRKLQKLVESGLVAIIPIGFRCYTKNKVRQKLKISQKSLPFDSGFFPPSSIVSVLKNPTVKLDCNDCHTVVKKLEPYFENDQKYIKFLRSTYEEIDSIVINKHVEDINKHLDSTLGYYTLVEDHDFVLAHYNWHKFSDISNNKGVTEPEINIRNINEIFTGRISRMFEICSRAESIVLIYTEEQDLNGMMIDEDTFYFDKKAIENVKAAFQNRFNKKTICSSLDDQYCSEKILSLLNGI